MITLNRQIQPPLIEIEKLVLPPASKVALHNGIPLYTIHSGKKEIIKLELLFKAGKWYEPEKLISKFCAKLMKEGTSSRSSSEIAEFFDFYGASIKVASNAELGSVTIYSLKKHLHHILPLVREILTEAIFPESEFEIFRNNSSQELLIKLQKNDFLASRKFLNVLYGDDHPFGYHVEPEDYDTVNLDQVKSFYKQYYTSNNCIIIASGLVDEKVTESINKYLGSGLSANQNKVKEPVFQVSENPQRIHFIEKENSVQSAVRIGMHLFNKTHADHPKLSVVNTLFGGYFSSRLMSNIREEKGYTYGIYSGLNSFLHHGHLMISTEVGNQFREDTINEISQEIKRLKTESVPAEELDMVKSYMISKVLRNLDGPFNLSNTYKKLWLYGLDENHLQQLIREIRSVEKDEVMELAKKYLSYEKMVQIAVG